MNKKALIFSIICFVIYGITIFMILKYSFETGEESSETSGNVTEIVGTVVETIAPDKVDTDSPEFAVFVRKAFGHFGLFAVNCLFGYLAIQVLLKKDLYNFLIILGVGGFLSIITEVIQGDVPQRAYSVTDMLIDFSGCIVGVIFSKLCCLVFYKIVSSKKTNNVFE